MPAEPKAGREGWSLGKREAAPGIKELTIELGEADIYVNLARRVDFDDGHALYEAVLTDAHGSRAIYIDREDVVECLRDVVLTGSTPPAPVDDSPRIRRPPPTS